MSPKAAPSSAADCDAQARADLGKSDGQGLAQKGRRHPLGENPPSCGPDQSCHLRTMSQHSTSDLLPLIPKLMRRARRLSSDRAEAEDLVQDTLLQLCARLRRDPDVDDLGAYTMQALNNRARRQWQKPQTEELEEDMAIEPSEVLNRIVCAEVLDAIGKLPEAQRQPLECVIEGETSPAAIATRLDIPLGTVMSRLARARARLRKELRDPTSA